MRFEWDPKKEESNRTRHGILFSEAIRVFDDPMVLIASDPKHSIREKRCWLIGETDLGKTIVVVFTEREGGVTRIISARPASRRERRIYEAFKGISI